MPRAILLIILVWALIVVIKRVVSSADHPHAHPQKPEEKFVQCAQCGLRIPESESQTIQNRILCNNPQCQNHSSR